MLGKAEYVKFTLRSICEERIRHFLSNVVIEEPQIFITFIKDYNNAEDFLNDFDLYKEFINRIPAEFVPLYRFAAFVSDNIGNLKKDKFDIKKEDGSAKAQIEEFITKNKLNIYEEVPGEWHLQKIFIQEVKKLKESL